VLRTVAKHSPQLAQAVVDSGAVAALVACLEEFDPGVKEAAAWALGYIARHNTGEWARVCVKVCVCVCVCASRSLAPIVHPAHQSARRACAGGGGQRRSAAADCVPAGARALAQAHLG
jgi:hypothetical protein